MRLSRLVRRGRVLPKGHFRGFDPQYYLYRYPDVALESEDRLGRYLTRDWREARDPSAGFSTNGYLAANADVAAAGQSPLVHVVRHGLAEGRGG